MGHYGIVHMITSALIHSAIYGAMYHVFKGLTAVEAVSLGVVIIGFAWFFYAKMNNKK
ncbi:hypothetical protein SFSGTM_32810 (plasmid) [Sulfuriferula nivalis]|uniref:Uncharacterized protein n=1 Tax=Sulfuriferula nivalis TaxID=2675298 RepID=A0A809SB97_9PROT|nr:hypothetical protein SFSGTM_32810 [Sulfuriferula nivalis]